MTGLVSKGRRQQQIANAPRFQKNREVLRQSLFGTSSKKICSCGVESSGIYSDGKMRCHKCKNIL